MATIISFLRDGVFDPKDIDAMSTALDHVCEALKLRDNSSARDIIATRIIDLARAGERSPTRLRDRVLLEAEMAERVNLNDTCEAGTGIGRSPSLTAGGQDQSGIAGGG